MSNITYIASKSASEFHKSNKVVRGFLGPVGNGKSVACINEMHRLCVEQEPNSNKIRLSKWAIIRNTYDMLETTTLATFRQWIPDTVCKVKLKPMRAHLNYDLPDGTTVSCQFIFLALDRPEDVRKMLSLEVSGVFINEAKELPYAVLKAARERIGRYPGQVDGYRDTGEYAAPRDANGNYTPCTRKAVIMDTNPPEDDHWWYQLAEEGRLRDDKSQDAEKRVAEVFGFFRGVTPLLKSAGVYTPNPDAENIEYLPGGYQYYLDMIAGNTEDSINVMVLGNYGVLRDGRSVYPQYNDIIHCPDTALGVIEGLPIGLGWDAGLTPACVVGQLTDRGQLRVIAELVAQDMGVRQFARDVVKPFLTRNFSGIEIAFSYIDPAGAARGEGDAKSAMGILNDDYIELDYEEGGVTVPLELGFTTEPAPTNGIAKRIDAINVFLTKLVDGAPGYLLSRSCKMLRKGKAGGYQYKRVRVSGDERYRDKPDKNKYSHPADAEQYMALGFVGTSRGRDYEDYDNSYKDVGVMGY